MNAVYFNTSFLKQWNITSLLTSAETITSQGTTPYLTVIHRNYSNIIRIRTDVKKLRSV